MYGGAAGQVVASRHPDFKEGDAVQSNLGWREYFISDGSGLSRVGFCGSGISHSLGGGANVAGLGAREANDQVTSIRLRVGSHGDPRELRLDTATVLLDDRRLICKPRPIPEVCSSG